MRRHLPSPGPARGPTGAPRRRCAVAATLGAAALLALLLPACRRSESERLGWSRSDLWVVPPDRLEPPSSSSGEPAFEAAYIFQAGSEVRDLSRVAANDLVVIPRLGSSRVRALRMARGTRATWRLGIGEEPYLSFRPIPGPEPCETLLRVTVAAQGVPPEQVHEAAGPLTLRPPAVDQVVDLARWAGGRIELTLEVASSEGAAEEACSIYWGSPGVQSLAAPVPRPRTDPRPNLLLLSPDTLRADALGAWGRAPSITPALDALAQESDVWLEAHSTFNVTNPSFASLMTGLYGRSHGVYDLRTPLPAEHDTLAELLSRAGYVTYGAIAAKHAGPHNSGLDQGFDELWVAEGHTAAEVVVNQALGWLSAPRRRPFFMWLHLYDPHTPHLPPAPFGLGLSPRERFGMRPVTAWVPFREPGPRAYRAESVAGARDLYAGEVAYLDRQIDRLLGFMESHGLLRDTLVALVADHGENLEEHGIAYRHAGLWDTTTHVPLMIRWPGERAHGRRLPGLVQQIDLFPTLLAAAGVTPPPQDGRDLTELAGPGRRGRSAAFSEHSDAQGRSVRTRNHRYFVIEGSAIVPDGVYFYDLEQDPREEHNLAGQGHPQEARLARLLETWSTQGPPSRRPTPRELSEEEAAELRALGYL